MATYITGNAYETILRKEAQAKMPWARLAEIVSEITRTSRGHQAVVPLLKSTSAADITDLGLDGAADTKIDVDSRDVVIPMRTLGKEYMTFDSAATLRETVVDRSLRDRLKYMAGRAALGVDSLAYSAVSAVPIDNGSGTGNPGNYTHEAGDHGTSPNYYFAPVADGLVHIGTDATSASSCAALYNDGSGKKITAQALRIMVAKLQARNVEPIGYIDSNDANSFLYACVLTDSQWLDLRAEVGDNSISATNKFVSSENRVYAGTWATWENLLLFVSPKAKQTYNDGASPTPHVYTVHRAVVFGRDYLALAATPADELPVADPNVIRMGVFRQYGSGEYAGVNEEDRPVARIFEIRQAPANDPQGRMWNISWFAHIGAKLLNPKAGIQLITTATND